MADAGDLEQIARWLRQDNPEHAHRIVSEVYQSIQSLKANPLLSRPGREDGTRELVFRRLPCVIVYRIKNEAIEVLRIWHASQNR